MAKVVEFCWYGIKCGCPGFSSLFIMFIVYFMFIAFIVYFMFIMFRVYFWIKGQQLIRNRMTIESKTKELKLN